MNIIKDKKWQKKYIFYLILPILLILPLGVNAFIDFCFSISITILVFVLGWPSMILYSLGYQPSWGLMDAKFIIVGTIVNIFLLFIFGLIIDSWRNKKNIYTRNTF